MNKLLIIGYIWPEPNKTAAGYRMLQIIDLFLSQNYDVVFCSAARIKSTSSQPLVSRNIRMIPIQLNDDGFDDVLEQEQPEIVLYDRFLVEEQYGWRVRNLIPDAMQILDTEDLHFLREARKQLVEERIPLNISFKSELTIREVSSLLRVDFSLIISIFEVDLLQDQFDVDALRLFYLPFLINQDHFKRYKSCAAPFEERLDFCTIGNLKHAPNLDSVRQLKMGIWPKIKLEIPQAQLFVYGSNAPREVLEMHDPALGFHVKGHTTSVDKVLSKHRVMLAPLRYGAGLKGKIFDAMKNGLPSIMTSTAAEGMFSLNAIPGIISNSNEDFISSAIQLYQDESLWNNYKSNGFKILQDDYKESAYAKALFHHIQLHQTGNVPVRSFSQCMMNHHADAHFKFMSYWIKSKSQKYY